MNVDELMKRAADKTAYRRLPGLYRKWDIESIIEPGFEYYVEEDGRNEAGIQLYTVYKRTPSVEIAGR